MILYAASDLLWATRIKATADDIGLSARPARTLEMLEARLADSDVRGLMVDLDVPETALALIERLRGPGASPAERAVRILAFGPHVAVELFQRAREAGADRVMARGGLADTLPAVLRRLDEPANTDA